MAKKLLYLNVWGNQEFKEEWRKKEGELERKVKRYGDLEYHKEFQDMETITSQFLKDGQNVVEIFGWTLPAVPSFIKSKLGTSGHIYLIDADTSEHELLINFIKAYQSFKRIEQGLEVDSHYHNRGTPLRYIQNRAFVAELEKALNEVDIEYVEKLVDNSYKPKAIKELLTIARKFYEKIGIEQIPHVLPSYPEKIGESSVDAVIEHNGFSFCHEEQKEGIVIGTDKILNPEGYIIFKDIPRQLVTVQYYGEDIFREKYSQITPEDMNYAHNWLVLKKGI